MWASLPRRSLERREEGTELVGCESSHPNKISTQSPQVSVPHPHPRHISQGCMGKSLKQEPVSTGSPTSNKKELPPTVCLAFVTWADSFLLDVPRCTTQIKDGNVHRNTGDTWKDKGLAGDVVRLVGCLPRCMKRWI